MVPALKVVLVVQGPNEESTLLCNHGRSAEDELWELPCGSPAENKASPALASFGEVWEQVKQPGWERSDLNEAILEAAEQAGLKAESLQGSLLEVVQEPDFGPGPPTTFVFLLIASTASRKDISGRWVLSAEAIAWSAHVDDFSPKLGPLALRAARVLQGPAQKDKLRGLKGVMEYPAGIHICPLKSQTLHPFSTTNLIVLQSSLDDETPSSGHLHTGRCLLVDPGASWEGAAQLEHVLECLSGPVIVFITHHHHDHVQGLAHVEKAFPDCVILGQAATLKRIASIAPTLTRSAVKGGDTLSIGKHQVEVIQAPGHTDGHLALYHPATGALIAGDHCVGKGSAILDSESGGDMQDYLDTTQRLLDLHPRVLISLHGRPCLHPKPFLEGYIKHRLDRESKILAAIKDKGAHTMLEVVQVAYADTPPFLWPAARQNVKLHVRRLAQLKELPEDFPLEEFMRAGAANFLLQVGPRATWSVLSFRKKYVNRTGLYIAAAAVVAAAACLVFVGRNTKAEGR